MSIALTRASLARLQPPVRVPAYDPAAVRAGIVHLGLGGFHRAHMARYTHELMERDPASLAYGIVGAGLQPSDRRMYDALTPQDNLYTLVERSSDAEAVSVIGSLARVIFAADGSAELLAAIDGDAIRIVSLTVTENGYCLNRATKQLDTAHPLIRHDLDNPSEPRSAVGIIVEAYRRRMTASRPPFTALSCDNIQHNGNVLRSAARSLATAQGAADLVAWIDAHASFPNTMVDRITPVTTDADRADLRQRYGIDDGWPVFCEPFTQWVIEDRFVQGRPPWEEVGAQFVADVTPYEFMKLRLLNASHLAVSGLGRLAGYVTVDETMRDPPLARYMAALMDRETGPTLAPVPGIDLTLYKRTLIERFANPAIRDTVERVNTDAPLNVLVDPIRDRLQAGQSVELLALALAAWLRRVRGEDEAGRPIEIKHPLAATLRERAIKGGENPEPLLGMTELFGDVGSSPVLIAALRRWLTSLYEVGSSRTLLRASEALGF